MTTIHFLEDEKYAALRTDEGGLYLIPQELIINAARCNTAVLVPTADGLYAVGAHLVSHYHTDMYAEAFFYHMDNAYIPPEGMSRFSALYAPSRISVFMKTGRAARGNDEGKLCDLVTTNEELLEDFPELSDEERQALRYGVDVKGTYEGNYWEKESIFQVALKALGEKPVRLPRTNL